MAQDPKKTEENPAGSADELAAEELDQVSGGAAYIKFDGIDGESMDKGHKGWSDLVSFSTVTSRKR